MSCESGCAEKLTKLMILGSSLFHNFTEKGIEKKIGLVMWVKFYLSLS
jgi:hypothetical protein